MNKYTEQHIQDTLKTLSSIEPSRASRRRADDHVRRIISGIETNPSNLRGIFYYAVASAAVLLIGFGLFWQSESLIQPNPPVKFTFSKPVPTLANLNAVLNTGGQQALNEYLDKIEEHRQPRAETLTLQDIMAEL